MIAFSVNASFALSVDKCEQYSNNKEVIKVLEILSQKLSYTFSEFCENPRIMDIYQTRIDVYMAELDEYHEHISVTLHYNEYSCEYRYNVILNDWGKQQCYNTF